MPSALSLVFWPEFPQFYCALYFSNIEELIIMNSGSITDLTIKIEIMNQIHLIFHHFLSQNYFYFLGICLQFIFILRNGYVHIIQVFFLLISSCFEPSLSVCFQLPHFPCWPYCSQLMIIFITAEIFKSVPSLCLTKKTQYSFVKDINLLSFYSFYYIR